MTKGAVTKGAVMKGAVKGLGGKKRERKQWSDRQLTHHIKLASL